jgi:flagellar export protein FliJ
MKKFQFKLESVLAVRERAEREAQQALAEQLALEGRCAADAAAAAARVHAARSLAARSSGTVVHAGDLRARQAYLERAERDGRTAARVLAAQQEEVHGERQRLEAAARAREVLERLKDRHHEAHLREVARVEEALLGEIALAGHRRRTAEAVS